MQVGKHDVETIRCATAEPMFEIIGDVLRAAEQDSMAASNHLAQQLANSRPFPVDEIDDQLLAALVRVRDGNSGGQYHRFVQRQFPQINPYVDEAGYALERHNRVEKILKCLVARGLHPHPCPHRPTRREGCADRPVCAHILRRGR